MQHVKQNQMYSREIELNLQAKADARLSIAQLHAAQASSASSPSDVLDTT